MGGNLVPPLGKVWALLLEWRLPPIRNNDVPYLKQVWWALGPGEQGGASNLMYNICYHLTCTPMMNFISMARALQDVRNYLMLALSTNNKRLLSDGLVNVVPHNGPGDKAKDYCINGFAIDNYSSPLTAWQRLHPKWCRRSLFTKTIELTRVKLVTIGYMLLSALPKHMSESVSQKVVVVLVVRKTDIYTDAFT
ncbi:hypothetical protein Cgig2_032150 [Carnegiea gigantea]|uniref:Uncharacterized protein n=1 Tax=Carnegiea gigantea TaxID=171969 RepID=A0A9Q1GSZ8_9CARY|nr:hypothetical protein Cgig2_032150 [Carnegiea gigantea]